MEPGDGDGGKRAYEGEGRREGRAQRIGRDGKRGFLDGDGWDAGGTVVIRIQGEVEGDPKGEKVSMVWMQGIEILEEKPSGISNEAKERPTQVLHHPYMDDTGVA